VFRAVAAPSTPWAEDAPAADAAGVNVFTMRLGAVLAGGILCGIAGTHLSLVGSHLWIDGMVAGQTCHGRIYTKSEDRLGV
jgi:hypothetical protein